MSDKVNLKNKFSLFSQQWCPKIIAQVNDSLVKIAKFEGEFVWHKHDDADELFLVVKGSITIKLKGQEVELHEGELFVVPKGVEHCPVAQQEAHVVLIEAKSVVNTGGVSSDKTVTDLEWI